MQTVNVDLGDRSYPIYIGKSLFKNTSLITAVVGRSRVLVVTNDRVAPLYLRDLQAMLGDTHYDVVILPDGEQHKNLATLNAIYEKLLNNRFDRGSILIALGGGVIGDITGFAAATYQRGIDFIQIPTTLLAQVDSSVGGKTGVNHPLGKNMIGAFHQPLCVLADTSVLTTLPERELKAGMAEVLKYGLINDADFFDWLDKNAPGIMSLDQELLSHVIRTSCEHKASIVAQDERESGVRALLNLGHTFGHAIETSTGYTQWLHGETVGMGMVMAADLSMRMGRIKPRDAMRIRAVIEKFGIPSIPPAEISELTYMSLMSSDKKVKHGRIRFVLLNAIGDAYIEDNVDSQLLSATLNAGQNLCRPDHGTPG